MNHQPQNPYQQNYVNVPNCLRCRTPMQPLMQMPVRTGGAEGFWSDGWGEMSERKLILDAYRCPQCRKLEFFDLDLSLPNR